MISAPAMHRLTPHPARLRPPRRTVPWRHAAALLAVLSLAACTTVPGRPPPSEPTPTTPPPSEPELVESDPVPAMPVGSAALEQARETVRGMTAYEPSTSLAALRLLEAIGVDELERLVADRRLDSRWRGWLDLARRSRLVAIADGDVAATATAWASAWPVHPLGAPEFGDLTRRWIASQPQPGDVAVLLPQSGALARAAEQLGDGLLGSYLARPAGGRLRFYDTRGDMGAARSAYFDAIDDGAGWIVGPLERSAVATVMSAIGEATPALYLNAPNAAGALARSPEALQFALALLPEQEAAAVGRRAMADGHRTAIVLAPASERGERVIDPFVEAFTAGDGEVLEVVRYDPAVADQSPAIRSMLELDESTARASRLESFLGKDVSFTATRRNDVDMIFLAATPDEGRAIRPQLRFHDAGDLPVYATGRIYAGRTDPVANRDLDGIVFATTPMQLDRGDDAGALAALGADAWRLVRWLPLMARDPGLVLPGHAGRWRSAPGLLLEREPAWAVFSDGVAVPAPPPPERPEARLSAR